MICFPNAKINLGLNIISKRPDGYHTIETIFYPIPLRDALEVVEANAFSFSQTGIPLDTPAENNLVVKAMRLLAGYGLPPLEVHLYKAIPSGAGLGGGSSDAAFMLKLLNDFGRLGLGESTLETMAAQLGADCPFFIRNTPVFASGIGNIFEPVSLSLAGYHLYLVTPDIAVSTAEAYAAVRPQFPSVSLKEIATLPIKEWKERMTNDFEQSIFARYPALAAIKQNLYEAGAVYASMSGSGSSVFGLFEVPVSKEALPVHLAGGQWFSV
ncbi:MAG: 4-(cytidine 5'-diphospho)-2-C-methyl-D-erythritol kinase [Tannerellaceae bacterium]|jgi:4-diphosphocytidyl-2-C-methyl-D-erythritol kinase|nr:4-(cytidine 5'-diphospho)-2-C-methyl-D-erythritol kinase [Tannerellaceae bacterium]